MGNKTIAGRIARVRELLKTIHHVPISTVNEDGSPHLSPVFMAFDERLNAYWASDPESLHSRNIARSHQVFLVVFDSREGHGGLYMQAEAQEIRDSAEIEHAYTLLKNLKTESSGEMGELTLYTSASQRLYCATPRRLWITQNTRTKEGIIIRDSRHEITLEDLLV